jgi:hypothetical protein
MDAEREKELDAALARMRAAFADLPEEQLMQDVAEIIERDRQEQRQKASARMRRRLDEIGSGARASGLREGVSHEQRP